MLGQLSFRESLQIINSWRLFRLIIVYIYYLFCFFSSYNLTWTGNTPSQWTRQKEQTSLKSALTTCFGTRAAHLEPIQLTSRHQLKVRPAFLSGHQGSQLSFYHLSINELPVKRSPLIRVHIGYLLPSHLPIFIDFSYQAASILTGETKIQKNYIEYLSAWHELKEISLGHPYCEEHEYGP